MTLAPLPVTVIAGYLGSGKTSLVNHLLRNAGGRRIMVMVNDFGALNIDADLLESAEDDTLTLSNGCICCTMGTELMYALAGAIDRRPRPDCLVIEASGVAQPAKIAAAAHAEPEMRYCGVVTLVDAANIAGLLGDPLIGAQVAAQVAAADLALVTKDDLASFEDAALAIAGLTDAPALPAPHGAAPVDLLLERAEAEAPRGQSGGGSDDHQSHGRHDETYRSWSDEGGAADRARLAALLQSPPPGLYRFKGRVALAGGGAVEAHLVGRTWSIKPAPDAMTRVAAIGVAPQFDVEDFARRWAAVLER